MAMGPILGSGRRGRRTPMAEINVTPMVDVMLVLLIIFMVTAPLLATGVQVDLPESKAAALDQDNEPVAISMDAPARSSSTMRRSPKAALGERLADDRARLERAGRPAHLPARRPEPRLWPGDARDGRAQPRRAAARRAGHHRRGRGALMERAEAAGLGVAVVAHARLARRADLRPVQRDRADAAIAPSIEVSFVDQVALDSASPAPASAPPPSAERTGRAR